MPLASSADPIALSITTEPALPIVMQSGGWPVFGATGAVTSSIRVYVDFEGSRQEVTGSCAFTYESQNAVVSPDGTFTLAPVDRQTIAAIVVECLGARQMVGFLLSPNTP